MYVYLTNLITEGMPSWPDAPGLIRKQTLSIEKGDVANTWCFEFYNHTGTHMDSTHHYLADGVDITSLPASYFVYEKPYVMDCPKQPCEKITAEDLIAHAEEVKNCDLLLFRTDFHKKYRATEPDTYMMRGPAIGSDAARWLVENCPNKRAVSCDFLSMASVSDQEDGNETHRILFRGKDSHFILGIEDVDMRPTYNKTVKKVFGLPWLIAGIDSTPVTIVAEVE